MIKDEIERIQRALGDLCEPLHDVFTLADQRRREQLPELADDPQYGWHATHTVRALAHHELSKRSLGVWRLSGNHARNGELWLTDDEYKLRVLHTTSAVDVPPPGLNAARRAYYRNAPLPMQMPYFGPINDRLLVLWRIYGSASLPVFRVVRTIGAWEWGAHAQTDLDFVLPESAEDLKDLQFEPTDDDLGLTLPRDEEEGGTSDAGGRTG